jgi:hypothetical protein
VRDKYHKWNECGEAFPSKKCLNTHSEVHVRDKSNKCDECGEAFPSKKCLNTHKEIHVRDKSSKITVKGRRLGGIFVDSSSAYATNDHRKNTNMDKIRGNIQRLHAGSPNIFETGFAAVNAIETFI